MPYSFTSSSPLWDIFFPKSPNQQFNTFLKKEKCTQQFQRRVPFTTLWRSFMGLFHRDGSVRRLTLNKLLATDQCRHWSWKTTMPLRTTRAGVGQTVKTGNGSPGQRPASKGVHEWEQQVTKIQKQTGPIRASPKHLSTDIQKRPLRGFLLFSQKRHFLVQVFLCLLTVVLH